MSRSGAARKTDRARAQQVDNVEHRVYTERLAARSKVFREMLENPGGHCYGGTEAEPLVLEGDSLAAFTQLLKYIFPG